MGILAAIVIGLIVGVIAKFLMPGRDPGGFIVTVLLGIGGAIFAQWIGTAMGLYHQNEPAGFLSSVIGAMLLLVIYRMTLGRNIPH